MISWLTSVFTMAQSQLSYTHPLTSNDLFEYSNCLGIHASCMIIVWYHSLFIWLYKSATSIAAPFCQFYAYLSEFFVRLCFQFLDHCDKLISIKWDKNKRFIALFIKLDFERAYEQVDWSNILAMLRALFWSIFLSGWWDV